MIVSDFPVFLPPAKAKGQSAKLNINAALVEDIVDLDALRAEMAAVVSALKDDFTRSLSIRTSLGNPALSRDNVVVVVLRSKQKQKQLPRCSRAPSWHHACVFSRRSSCLT